MFLNKIPYLKITFNLKWTAMGNEPSELQVRMNSKVAKPEIQKNEFVLIFKQKRRVLINSGSDFCLPD
jgi:hypothetical protein